MTIAFVSAWDEGYAELASVTSPSVKAYCTRHGYHYHSICHASGLWARWHLARQLLPKYDLVTVVDADLLITNPSIKVETFLDGTDLLASYDINGLNCGVVFIRNTSWSNDFMAKWLEEGRRFPEDQTALAYLLYREPKERWRVVNQRSFNSYRYELYPGLDFPSGQWQEGDFILHVPALSLAKKLEILTQHKTELYTAATNDAILR